MLWKCFFVFASVVVALGQVPETGPDSSDWEYRGPRRDQKQGEVLLPLDAYKPSSEEELQLPGMPRYLREPPSVLYVTKQKPALVECIASPANYMDIKCSNRAKPGPNKRLEMKYTIKRQQYTIHVNITEQMVEEWFAEFWCQCEAWNNVPDLGKPKAVFSRKTIIKIGYLQKRFKLEPMATSVKLGSRAELNCLPPEGKPDPTIHWLKNGQWVTNAENSLVIEQAQLSDKGNYTCVATNPVGLQRKSSIAHLNVFVDGGWSPWSVWSACPAACESTKYCAEKCRTYLRRRERTCTQPVPLNDGASCMGRSKERSTCDAYCAVDGGWSQWLPWSPCSMKCVKTRRRLCDSPKVQGNGQPCLPLSGAVMSRNCTGNLCPDHNKWSEWSTWSACTRKCVQYRHRTCTTRTSLPCQPAKDGEMMRNCSAVQCRARYDDQETRDTVMYMGICTGLFIMLVVTCIVVYLCRRRDFGSAHMLAYRMTNGNNQNCRQEKNSTKTHETAFRADAILPPDLTQTHHKSPDPTYKAPSGNPALHSNGNQLHAYSTPITQNHQAQLPLVATYANVPESPRKALAERTPLLKKAEPSPASSALYHEVPLGPDIDVTDDLEVRAAWTMASSAGGRLTLPECGVSITIPNGALTSDSQEVYLAVGCEDKDRPILTDEQTLLSSVIMCGPPCLKFVNPVVVSFPHCASLHQGAWKITLLSSDVDSGEPADWKEYLQIGQETLNSPAYCQLDQNTCHLITGDLKRFCLIGSSTPEAEENAYKNLRLAAFAQPITSLGLDFTLRVYVLGDTKDNFEKIVNIETRQGGRLIDTAKQLLYEDSGDNLCFCIEEMAPGWRSRLHSKYQEVPFSHIWRNSQTNLHCSFAFEHLDPSKTMLSCKIIVYQNNHYSNHQTIHVNSNIELISEAELAEKSALNWHSPSLVMSPLQVIFRLTPHRRKQIVSLLDPPNAAGNDWRMLARQLGIDRYINYFATKTSPTESILDLWEARNRDETAIIDLKKILRAMGRPDVVVVLDQVWT